MQGINIRLTAPQEAKLDGLMAEASNVFARMVCAVPLPAALAGVVEVAATTLVTALLWRKPPGERLSAAAIEAVDSAFDLAVRAADRRRGGGDNSEGET